MINLIIKYIYYPKGQNITGLPVDECKIRPKGVERNSKGGKGATNLSVGFPLLIN